MARELDSEMLQRLQSSYGQMSDGELLELAARPDDLTDIGLEVLRGEMQRRRLQPKAAAPPIAGEVYKPVRAGSAPLMTFHDAIAAGEACEHLEEAGISVEVRDVSAKVAGRGSFYGGPPVALEVIVQGVDRERAVGILREKMGLFPLQEVAEADELVDDGTISALGYFGKRDDAEEVARVLEDASMWHRIVANAEGTEEDENAYSVEVREIDLVKAGELVERAMGLPEG
jgi:hypothetical protein